MLEPHHRLAIIPGIGNAYAKRLALLGLETVEDLLFYFPFRYDDLSNVSSAETMKNGELTTYEGTLSATETIYTRNRKAMTKALFSDGSGTVPIIWFNQPYLSKSMKVGERYRLAGKVGEYNHHPTLVSPKVEKIKSEYSLHSGRLVAIYGETEGINSKWLREKVAYILANLHQDPVEYVPLNLLQKYSFPNLKEVIGAMHFPTNFVEVTKAKKRLGYEEMLISQLRSGLNRARWNQQKVSYRVEVMKVMPQVLEFIESLPFKLTDKQQQAVDGVLSDLDLDKAMNRLVEGDVGSGKTIVALIAAYATFLAGYKTLIMAPTQILAQQHYANAVKFLEPLGVKAQLVSGASKEKSIQPDTNLIVGTHALLFLKEQVEGIALTVIDEQHRFGVKQRAKLRSQHGLTHTLTMTATPIPRTLALTMYGDLELSLIDEMPVGRKPIKTWVVPDAKRQDAYIWIKKQIRETGEQVFIVCPFIETSESNETVKAAVTEYSYLKEQVFPEFKVGLLHGGMKAGEKDPILLAFRDKQYDILVCTPVVEVGIDIPNASVMIIESAERFGLAQLHQLRGRVGRGGQQAYCYLFTSQSEETERLKHLSTENSGLKLAELDLRYRGGGDLFGTAQHGRQVFRYADLFDLETIKLARADAENLLEEDTQLQSYPELASKVANLSDLIEAN